MAERPLRSRWYGGFTWLASADPRAIGLFRIAFGLMCIWDVIRRVPWIELFFTNQGVIPNHFSLFRPHATYMMSLLHAFKTPGRWACSSPSPWSSWCASPSASRPGCSMCCPRCAC
ncbi:MAG: hypothetical protein R3F43_03365 [bacterium]